MIKLEPSISLISLLNILLTMQFLFCNSQGLFYMPSHPRLSAMNMQSSQERYFCSCISSANAMHNATPARVLRSCHTLPPRGMEPSFGHSLFFEYFPRTPALHTEHGSWVKHGQTVTVTDPLSQWPWSVCSAQYPKHNRCSCNQSLASKQIA